LALVRSFGDTAAWTLPSDLRVLGPYLLLADAVASPHVWVMDRATGDVVGTYGTSGRGPREVVEPNLLLPESEHPPRVWLSDFYNRRAVLLDLSQPDSAVVIQSLNLTGDWYTRYPVFTAHGMLAGGQFPEATLALTDSSGEQVTRWLGTPPFDLQDYPTPSSLLTMNRYVLTTDPRRERVALAYLYANRLDLFSVEGNLLASTHGPDSVPIPAYRLTEHGQVMVDASQQDAYNGGVTATDRYVYAAFCGCTHTEWRDGVKPHLVQVFAWDGTFVTQLDVGHQITSVAVAPGDSVMYTTSRDPVPIVSEWRLPSMLRVPN